MERDGLPIRAVLLALNERFLSRCMPSSLKDLELGFSCVLCILSSSVTSDGSCGVSGRLLSKQRTGTTSIFLEGTWKIMYLVLLTLMAILLLVNQSASFVSSVLTLVRRFCRLESESVLWRRQRIEQ
jgi:hypothetical protein